MSLLAQRPGTVPLDGRRQRMVETNLVHLRGMLYRSWYRGYSRMLGRDDAYGTGCLAFVRAAAEFDFNDFQEEHFKAYAAFWLRHYLSNAAMMNGLVRSAANRVAGRPGPARNIVWTGSLAEQHLDVNDGGDRIVDWLFDHVSIGKVASTESDPLQAAEMKDAVRTIMRILAGRPRLRYVLQMRALGFSLNAIGANLKISGEYVRILESDAVKMVRKRLGVT